MTDKENYLEPSVFYAEVVKCLIDGKMSNELGEMFTLVSTRYTNHRHFVRYYHLKEDLIATGAMACCKSFSKFEPLKRSEPEWDGKTPIDYHYTRCNNPFAFFTTCVRNEWLQFLKKDYRSKNAVNALRVANGLDADYGYNDMIQNQEAEKARSNEPQDAEPPEENNQNWVKW